MAEFEDGLKAILEKRKLEVEPLGQHSWICILKAMTEEGLEGYKLLNTGRIKVYETKPGLVAIIKERGGEGDYLLKVLRRILKPKSISAPRTRTTIYQLDDADLTWLKSLNVCNGTFLSNEVIGFLGANTISQLRKEGLCPSGAPR